MTQSSAVIEQADPRGQGPRPNISLANTWTCMRPCGSAALDRPRKPTSIGSTIIPRTRPAEQHSRMDARTASIYAKLPNEPEKLFVFNEHSAHGPMRRPRLWALHGRDGEKRWSGGRFRVETAERKIYDVNLEKYHWEKE